MESKVIKGIRMKEVVVDNHWSPENPGDSIFGIYLYKEENVGNWNKNRYTLDVDGEEKYVYGTSGLDGKFKEINPGHAVEIIFIEEKPSRPPKKPFKVFKVFQSEEPVVNSKSADFMDDPVALNEIEIIKKELNNANATSEEIAEYAKKHQKELGYTGDDLTKVLKQAAKMNKEGK